MEFLNDLGTDVAHSCDNDMFSERTSSSGPPSPAGLMDSSLKSVRGKRKIDKLCMVCGDKALGCNFDAVTCESCKAFFRRNAMKDDIPKCIFERQCKVDMNTRRFCTFCRLQKCLRVGMKKDMILDDDQKRQRMEKVRQNRQRRQVGAKTPLHNALPDEETSPGLLVPQATPVSSSSSSSISSASSVSPLGSGAPQIDLSTMAHAAVAGSLPLIKADIAWESRSADSGFTYDAAISAVALSSCELPQSAPLNGSGGGSSTAEQQMVSLNSALSRRDMARLLSQDEWNAVSDLTEAYKSSFLETADKTPEGKCSLISLVNTSGFIVRKLINFAKKLSDFTNLPQACQIALLKGVVLNTLFLRSATHYDPDKNVWITPRGEVPASILQEATGYRDLYEEHGKFCRQFLMVVDKDEHLVPLIQVLSLFAPDRPQLGDQHQHVSDIQDRYVCLTKHYLEARHGYAVSRRRFHQVLMCMEALQSLTDNHGKVLLHVDPDEVDPLMLEVFDLKTSFLSEATASTKSLIHGFAGAIFNKMS